MTQTSFTVEELQSKKTGDPFLHLPTEANVRWMGELLAELNGAQTYNKKSKPENDWIEAHKVFTSDRITQVKGESDCMGNQWMDQDAMPVPQFIYTDDGQVPNPAYVP